MAHLRLFRGNRPERIELTEASYVLGRSQACQIVLENDAVSRRHARILRRGETFLLEDLASRNKTFLNGNLIQSATELADNDIIRICNYHILFLGDTTTDSSRFQIILRGEKDDSTQIKLMQDVSPDESQYGLNADAQPRQKLNAYLEINRTLATAMRFDTMTDRVLDCLFRIFPQSDQGYILLRSEGTSDPVPKAARSRRGDTRARFSRTILRHVFDQGKALLAEDASIDPLLAQHGSVVENLIHSIMCVPLLGAGDRPMGAIWLHTEDRARLFVKDDLDLLLSAASMIRLGLERARMHEQLLAHQRRLGETEAGRNVQQAFLPIDWPYVPGYRFYANCRSALSVGGDYFGFITLPDERLAIALGDVSGNGLAAALLMARLSSVLRFAAISSSGPAEVVQKLNRVLQAEWPTDRFVTLLYAELDRRHGQLSLINAGHLPPLFRSAAGHVQPLGTTLTGPPLNTVAEYPFQASTIPLQPGDIMLFYTDGLVDACSSRTERFGAPRLQETFRQTAPDPERAGANVMEAVLKFIEGTPQIDDIALVSFGREASS